MFFAASCFCSGLFVAAIGVNAHRLWLVYLGYGVIGGCGLGIGYISPVSTLIKWFPDRPGMATGTAIMGFGGGALIGAPLSVLLMKHFANATGNRRRADDGRPGRALFHLDVGRCADRAIAARGMASRPVTCRPRAQAG